MEPAEDEVHLGVFCLHMSSDSDKELECLGSREPVGNNDSNGLQPVNTEGVAYRTRRAKDTVDGYGRKSPRYWCSCCDQDSPKEKKKKQTNKASKDSAQAQAIPAVNEKADGENVFFQDPGRDLNSSPSRKRATWNPRDEIELASAVLDGINSGLDGVKNGADVMDLKSHKQFWEDVSENVQNKTGQDRSKNQIIEKFKKLKTRFFTNAEQKQSAVRSSDGHEEQLTSILQQIFGSEEEQSANLQETLQTPSELTIVGNEDQVSLTRHWNNKGSSDLKDSVQDQVFAASNGVEEGVKPVNPREDRALSKAKHREELASAILDGIKSGLDAVEVGADLTSVESFNQFWENITEILQKKTGQVQSKYQIIQEFRKMQESHVANAMQQSSAMQTNDGQEEQLFRILQQNPGDEKDQDILDTSLKEGDKGSEDQASKPETRNILDQEARQGGKRTCNGISYVLCLPSPNQTIIWSLQNHGSRKKKPEGRDLQDEMAIGTEDQEHNLSSPVQKKSGKASKNNLSSLVQKKLVKDSTSNRNSRGQKVSEKISENNPSSPTSPGRKPVKRKFSYEVTIAEVISRVSQSSKRRRFAEQSSEKISVKALESSPSPEQKKLANTSKNAKESSPTKSAKASKSNLSSPEKELAKTLESEKQSSQKKLAKSPESNLSSPRQKKLAKTSENNPSSVSLFLPRRKLAKRNSQYEVTMADMISKDSQPSKRSKSARESSQKKSVKASEINPSCPQQKESSKTSEIAEQSSQKKSDKVSEGHLSSREQKELKNTSEISEESSQKKLAEASESNLSSPEQTELVNTSENAKQSSEKKLVKASESNPPFPELKESANSSEDVKQSSQKKSYKASRSNLFSPEQKELENASENAKQFSEKKLVKASETNSSSPELKESAQTSENAKQSSQKNLAKASERIPSSPEQKELSNTSEDAKQSSQKKSAKALERNPSLLGQKELTETSENNLSSPISPKRKSAGRNSQYGVTIHEMISKSRQSSKISKSAKRSLQVELNIPAEALKCNQPFLSKVKSADQTSPIERGSVAQVSNDGGFSQVLLNTKPSKWRSNEEVVIASAVLDAIKSGQFDVELGCDDEWGKHLKLWEEVHKQIQSKTNKKCTVNQVSEKFMKMRKKFLKMREIPCRKDRVHLDKHEQLFDIYQEIWHKEQSTVPTEEKSEMNKASPVSENITSEMNVSKCLEVVLSPSICTGTQDEQHRQMEDFPARASRDSSAVIKQVQDKCRGLQTEEETGMNKASPVSENVTLEMNVSNCLEVVPQPSICTGTQDEQHKQMEDSPTWANCDSSAGTKQVRDKYEELQTGEDIEMKNASPVSDNVTLGMNVAKCLEVVPLPSICTETQLERHKQMEYSPARENCDSSAGIKHVQDKCEELRNETRAICVEMWQDCEEKFHDMQSRINEMLDNKMKELKETHAVKDPCFNEGRLFFREESSGGNGNPEMHLLMEKHLKYRSKKLQLMQELCKIEEEELETQHLMSKLKDLRSHSLM